MDRLISAKKKYKNTRIINLSRNFGKEAALTDGLDKVQGEVKIPIDVDIHVLLIGQYPPPIGGVTMHIKRFFDRYKNDHKIELTLLDIKKKKVYVGNQTFGLSSLLLKIMSADIAHIHLSGNIKIMIAFIFKVLGKKVIYTHHNIRIDNMALFKLFMFFVDKLILVNDKDIHESVKKYNYVLIPAFLPTTESTPLSIPVIDKLRNYKYIISTNCFQMTIIDGKDIYGFDLCIQAFGKLVKQNKIKDSLLVLVDPSGTSMSYVKKLVKTFKNNNNCSILFIDNMIDFNELSKKSTMILRATRSDGDSLTVREALYLQIPVIASDVTYRPEGTILFENENSDDLSNRILDVINGNILSNQYYDLDYGEEIVNIYRRQFVSNDI